jgi:hypothetical protein
MAKPVILAVDDPQVLQAVERDLRHIVRRIVVAHGGEVAFDSTPGKTRFVVRLPMEGRNTKEG